MFVDNSLLDTVLRGTLLAALAMMWITLLVRIVGLRSFSKMTSFDFVMTLACGSLLAAAAQATDWLPLLQIAAALAALFAAQFAAARLRRRSSPAKRAMENVPTILMENGEFDEAALDAERVAKGDVLAKLRQANALDFQRVRAVVLETTGDISVLYGDTAPDERLLAGLRRSRPPAAS